MKNSLDRDYKFHGRFLGWGSGADADWRVMFSVFLILLVVLSIIWTLLYRSVASDFASQEAAVESPINKNLLKRTSVFYEKQKLDFESAKTVPEITPDPSL